jgi:phosphopantothenate synthetase
MNCYRSSFKNPKSKESAEKSLKFVDEIIRLSPPITEASARKLQKWSDKYPEETTQLSMLLNKEAIKLLNVLINTKSADLGLTDDEAAN